MRRPRHLLRVHTPPLRHCLPAGPVARTSAAVRSLLCLRPHLHHRLHLHLRLQRSATGRMTTTIWCRRRVTCSVCARMGSSCVAHAVHPSHRDMLCRPTHSVPARSADVRLCPRGGRPERHIADCGFLFCEPHYLLQMHCTFTPDTRRRTLRVLCGFKCSTSWPRGCPITIPRNWHFHFSTMDVSISNQCAHP